MEKLLIAVVAILLIAHIFLAFFATIEAKDYPLIGGFKKAALLSVIWLVPIAGTLFAHKVLNLGWAKGVSGSGDVTTGGYSGGDGGGGCGGDGGC